jgi:stress response protein YsnF
VSDSGSASGGRSSAAATSRDDAIPVLEEKAFLEKKLATKARVRVATQTKQVDEITTATLQGEEVEVTRVPVGTPVVGEAPQIRTEGDTTIVPVFEEVLVVEKRLMLKEELHIRRQASEERVEISTPLRKQEVKVERIEE